MLVSCAALAFIVTAYAGASTVVIASKSQRVNPTIASKPLTCVDLSLERLIGTSFSLQRATALGLTMMSESDFAGLITRTYRCNRNRSVFEIEFDSGGSVVGLKQISQP